MDEIDLTAAVEADCDECLRAYPCPDIRDLAEGEGIEVGDG